MSDEKPSDAELIERARGMSGELKSMPVIATLFGRLADRLAELTKPEPWRSPSEPPTHMNDVFVRYANTAGTQSVKTGYYDTVHKSWVRLPTVTGWQPIVRPEP
jgi:hypothetical protein